MKKFIKFNILLLVLVIITVGLTQVKESTSVGQFSPQGIPISRNDSTDVDVHYLNTPSTTVTIGPFLAWPFFSIEFDLTVATDSTLDIDSVAYYGARSLNSTSTQYIKQKLLLFKSNTNRIGSYQISSSGTYASMVTEGSSPIMSYKVGKVVVYLGSNNSLAGNSMYVRKIAWNQGY